MYGIRVTEFFSLFFVRKFALKDQSCDLLHLNSSIYLSRTGSKHSRKKCIEFAARTYSWVFPVSKQCVYRRVMIPDERAVSLYAVYTPAIPKLRRIRALIP